MDQETGIPAIDPVAQFLDDSLHLGPFHRTAGDDVMPRFVKKRIVRVARLVGVEQILEAPLVEVNANGNIQILRMGRFVTRSDIGSGKAGANLQIFAVAPSQREPAFKLYRVILIGGGRRNVIAPMREIDGHIITPIA
ncbi:hypothetical protein A3842_21800 [Paenibacillus sp. P3E]|nr:hypothetical protein A3842_21800 [Paenibacillus sp. P3E]